MVDQRTKTARAVAVMVLNRFDPKRNYVSPIMDKLLRETDEKQRTTDLALGTIRNRSAIDAVIDTFSGIPIQRISSELLNIIRIAVFELIYSPATPEYSIVNEAVESTKKIAGKKQSGFVNAVLRQITRHISNRQSQLSQANHKATLPQIRPGRMTSCEFDKCFLPDPKTSLADYLSTAFSLPKWLITDWLGEFGTELTQQICFANNRRPSIYIRPNRLKTTAQELVEKLRQAGIDAEIVPKMDPVKNLNSVRGSPPNGTNAIGDDLSEQPGISNGMEMIRLKSPRAVTELPGFTEGLFTVQDITASQAVRFLQPQPSWKILDLCAAPGTKTTQLAEMTGDSAQIIATDIDGQRLKMVKENITRLDINNVSIIAYEQVKPKAAKIGLLDAVLLDVPCSNTGVLAKRLEVRYRIKPETITKLTKIQADLLDKAVTMIKPGGKICYSTCSIQKAENSELVTGFLQKNHDLELQYEQLQLPSTDESDHDGGYVAIIVKLKDRSQKSNVRRQIS